MDKQVVMLGIYFVINALIVEMERKRFLEGDDFLSTVLAEGTQVVAFQIDLLKVPEIAFSADCS